MDDIVAQALEVAQAEAEARQAEAEVALATEQRNVANEETAQLHAGEANETAIEIATIQAERDVEVARLASESVSLADSGPRFSALEERLGRMETELRECRERLTRFEVRAQPERNIEHVSVNRTVEKPKPKKPPVQTNGGLYFGR